MSQTISKAEIVVNKAMCALAANRLFSDHLVYELQQLPRQAVDWDLFYAMADKPNRSDYYAVLIPVTLKLMYPLLTHCYQIANAKSRYTVDEDLQQIIALKLMEEWLPNFDHEKGEFPSYIINRFKREALRINDVECSEYIQKKYGESNPIVSYEGYLQANQIDEDSFCVNTYGMDSSSEFSGASAEDIFMSRENIDTFQRMLNLTHIRSDVKSNVVGEVTKEDAKDFAFITKLFGGMDSQVMTKCLKNIESKQGGMQYADSISNDR